MSISRWLGIASFSFVSALPASLALVSGAISPLAVQAQVVKGLPDFTELVELVGPSVVNIRTLEKAKANAQGCLLYTSPSPRDS